MPAESKNHSKLLKIMCARCPGCPAGGPSEEDFSTRSLLSSVVWNGKNVCYKNVGRKTKSPDALVRSIRAFAFDRSVSR